MANQCYYDILNVSRSADQDAIDSAYRRLARTHHPDKNLSSSSLNKMQLLNEAYEVLSNPWRRKAYDAKTSVPQFKSRRTWSDSSHGNRPSLKEEAAIRMAQRLAAAGLRPSQIVRELEKQGVDRGMAVFIVFARTDAPQRTRFNAGVADMVTGGMIFLLAAAGAAFVYAQAEAAGWYVPQGKISWPGRFTLPLLIAMIGGVKFLRGLFLSAKA
jgi:hypothetical protein